MSAHFLINIIENTGFKFLKLPLGILGGKGVGILKFLFCTVVISHFQDICRFILPGDQNSKKSGLISHFHGVRLSSAGQLYRHSLGSWNQRLDQKPLVRKMRPQHPVRIGRL